MHKKCHSARNCFIHGVNRNYSISKCNNIICHSSKAEKPRLHFKIKSFPLFSSRDVEIFLRNAITADGTEHRLFSMGAIWADESKSHYTGRAIIDPEGKLKNIKIVEGGIDIRQPLIMEFLIFDTDSFLNMGKVENDNYSLEVVSEINSFELLFLNEKIRTRI